MVGGHIVLVHIRRMIILFDVSTICSRQTSCLLCSYLLLSAPVCPLLLLFCLPGILPDMAVDGSLRIVDAFTRS
jgi:hypothetical protein